MLLTVASQQRNATIVSFPSYSILVAFLSVTGNRCCLKQKASFSLSSHSRFSHQKEREALGVFAFLSFFYWWLQVTM